MAIISKAKIMMVIGTMYPQYWLNLGTVERSFILHIVIKSTFCVAHKIIDGIMVPLLLDSHKLDVQSFCFKLTMSHNVKGAMAEHFLRAPKSQVRPKVGLGF